MIVLLPALATKAIATSYSVKLAMAWGEALPNRFYPDAAIKTVISVRRIYFPDKDTNFGNSHRPTKID